MEHFRRDNNACYIPRVKPPFAYTEGQRRKIPVYKVKPADER